jgi:hypothetical protein
MRTAFIIALMVDAVGTDKTVYSDDTRATRRYIPEGCNLHTCAVRMCELKKYDVPMVGIRQLKGLRKSWRILLQTITIKSEGVGR